MYADGGMKCNEMLLDNFWVLQIKQYIILSIVSFIFHVLSHIFKYSVRLSFISLNFNFLHNMQSSANREGPCCGTSLLDI